MHYFIPSFEIKYVVRKKEDDKNEKDDRFFFACFLKHTQKPTPYLYPEIRKAS